MAFLILSGSSFTIPSKAFTTLPVRISGFSSTLPRRHHYKRIMVTSNNNNNNDCEQTVVLQLYKNKRGIIFDIDGTLADSWKLGFDATLAVMKNNNLGTITEAEYHEYTRYCTPDRLARHAGLEPSDDENEAATSEFVTVGTRLGKEFDDLYVDLVSTETAGFYPGMHELLEALSCNDDNNDDDDDDDNTVRLGALTNACVAYAHAVLRVNTNMMDSTDNTERCPGWNFQSVHGADDVPAPKPSAEGLWLVCKELNCTPNECVYIGDSPSDAKAAKNAGMAAIGVLWGSHSKESLENAPFDHLCETVEELRLLLPTRTSTTSQKVV